MTHIQYLKSQMEQERDPVYTCAQCGSEIDTSYAPEPVEALVPSPSATRLNPFRVAYFCNEVCRSESAFQSSDALGRTEMLSLYAALLLLHGSEVEHRAPAAGQHGLLDDVRIGEEGAWKFLSFAEFLAAGRAFLEQIEPSGDEARWALPAHRAVDGMSETLPDAVQQSMTANVSGKKVQ